MSEHGRPEMDAIKDGAEKLASEGASEEEIEAWAGGWLKDLGITEEALIGHMTAEELSDALLYLRRTLEEHPDWADWGDPSLAETIRLMEQARSR